MVGWNRAVVLGEGGGRERWREGEREGGREKNKNCVMPVQGINVFNMNMIECF